MQTIHDTPGCEPETKGWREEGQKSPDLRKQLRNTAGGRWIPVRLTEQTLRGTKAGGTGSNCSYLLITGYSSDNDEEACAKSSLFWEIALLKAPNAPVREFSAAGADMLNRMSTVHPGIKIEPLLHKNKNMYHLQDGDGTVLEGKKKISWCQQKPAVSAGGWLSFLGLRTSQVLDRVSSQEPAEDGPTSFGHLHSFISTGPDRKREGNTTKWPNFWLQGRRYTRQKHNCSPSAAKTLQKPVLHMKPSTRPHMSVLLMFYYKKHTHTFLCRFL